MDIKNFDYHFYIYINDLNATILDTEGKAYDDYEKNHAAELQKDHNAKFGGRFVAFRSLMLEL